MESVANVVKRRKFLYSYDRVVYLYPMENMLLDRGSVCVCAY